jgi:hypothetical protein
LDVIDNQAIDRQRPKPHYLLGHDGLQLLQRVITLNHGDLLDGGGVTDLQSAFEPAATA